MNTCSFFPNLKNTIYVTLTITTVLSILLLLSGFHQKDEDIPVALIGVHHLGPEYRIHEFYLDKQAASSISEGGGGGGHVCCFILPRKWRSGLKAEVRWNVHHNLPGSNQALSPQIESGGIYKALVPVESYKKPGKIYVHFFPQGRVRIVVSSFSAIADKHPVKWADPRAAEGAITGVLIETIFTPEELPRY